MIGTAGLSASAGSPAAPPGPAPISGPGGVQPAGVIAPLAVSAPSHSESVFVPVTPCRIVDTRHGGGALGPQAQRTFFVRGTFGFAPQGGTTGGCGVPAAATGVATSVTVTSASADGYLTGWPYGKAKPTANFMWFWHDRTNTSNPTFALPSTPVTTAHGDLDIYGFGASEQIIIDINGYYEQPIEGLVYTGNSTTPGSGYQYSGSPRILSVTWIAVGIADVTVDADVTYCTPIAGGYYGSDYLADAKAFNGNKIRIYTWRYDDSTHLPVPVNNYAYFTVMC